MTGEQQSTNAPVHFAGKRIPLFKARARRTPLNASAINPVVSVFNAILNMKVERSAATPDADGNAQPYGRVFISDSNIVIHLYDA